MVSIEDLPNLLYAQDDSGNNWIDKEINEYIQHVKQQWVNIIYQDRESILKIWLNFIKPLQKYFFKESEIKCNTIERKTILKKRENIQLKL